MDIENHKIFKAVEFAFKHDTFTKKEISDAIGLSDMEVNRIVESDIAYDCPEPNEGERKYRIINPAII